MALQARDGAGDARPSPVKGAAAPVVQVVQKASEMCGDAEVEPGVSMNEALMDPKMRASAAKWRSGNETRRITALCARLMNGLSSIKPAWLEGLSDGRAEPQPVRPLPHHQEAPSLKLRTYRK